MTDRAGTQTYQYSQLSQLVSETRSFTDSLPNAPLANNSFKLQYAYGLSGQLQSLTDPYGQQINYGHDKAGRLQSVTGTSFGGITTYAENPHYRAWGGLQNLSYGNGTQMSLSFDNKLQATDYTLSKGNQAIMQKSYQFYTDGSLRYVQDQLDPKFDRFNRYDFVGRITEGRSGAEARGQSVASQDMATQLPYRQSYAYDAFDHLTQRNNLHWGVESWYGQSNNLSYSYQNNRINLPNAGWSYDADGRVLLTGMPDESVGSTYDASGMLVRLSTSGSSDIYRIYSGDGREVKRRTLRWEENPYSQSSPYGQWTDEGNTYYIRSLIIGDEVITEANNGGGKIKTNVIANGATIATQSLFGTMQSVNFNHTDPSGMSFKTTDATGNAISYGGTEFSGGELDPLGGNMGIQTPYVEPLINTEPPPSEVRNDFSLYEEDTMMVNGFRRSCALDGIAVPCSMAMQALENGSAAQCPNNDCSPRRVIYQGEEVWANFYAYADGYSGFVPSNARYSGKGVIAPGHLKEPVFSGRGGRYPNDTDLVILNGASGERINKGEELVVLNYIGVDAYWNMKVEIHGGSWNVLIDNRSRERISDPDVKLFRNLMERTMATDRCAGFLKKIGIKPEDILKAFDLTRVQQGFSWGADDAGGLNSSDIYSAFGSRTRIRKSEHIASLVETFIHETIHASGPNDDDMAKLFGEKKVYPDRPNVLKYKAGPGNTFNNSLAWTAVFSFHCTPTEAEIKKWAKK